MAKFGAHVRGRLRVGSGRTSTTKSSNGERQRCQFHPGTEVEGVAPSEPVLEQGKCDCFVRAARQHGCPPQAPSLACFSSDACGRTLHCKTPPSQNPHRGASCVVVAPRIECQATRATQPWDRLGTAKSALDGRERRGPTEEPILEFLSGPELPPVLLHTRRSIAQLVLPGLYASLQVLPRRCFESRVHQAFPARH